GAGRDEQAARGSFHIVHAKGDGCAGAVFHHGLIRNGSDGGRIVHWADVDIEGHVAQTKGAVGDGERDRGGAELVRGGRQGEGAIGAGAGQDDVFVRQQLRVGRNGHDVETADWR